MSAPNIPCPPFDPAYTLAKGFPGSSGEFSIEEMRSTANKSTVEDIISKFPTLKHEEHIAPGIQNLSTHPVPISIFQHKSSSSPPAKPLPIILHVHAGGQVAGNRFWQFDALLSLLTPYFTTLLIATVEYRLAPEHRAPAAAHDVYAATAYLSTHAEALGIDPTRILLHSLSGGGAPAAATCLLARTNPQVNIRGLMLNCPMLDDREIYTSCTQFSSGTLWPGSHNRAAWSCVLGSQHHPSPSPAIPAAHRADVSDNELQLQMQPIRPTTPAQEVSYSDIQVPGRAVDLTNLPAVYVDVGECEVFRDSAVAFAARVLAAGGSCEVHVWPGMFHAGSFVEPDVWVSRVAAERQVGFMERVLGLERE